MGILNTADFFTPNHTKAWKWLEKSQFLWDIIPQIGKIIIEIGENLDPNRYYSPSEHIWIAKTATVASTASITAPCIIGENTEVRHCAFIRGNALVGDGCVIGNSVELKNCIISDECEVPHFNYVGDSVLGFRAHMGAGSITSNIKSDRTLIKIKYGGHEYETGMQKIGAFLGDSVEVGCNCVLNPGTIIGRNSIIYPLSSVRGVVGEWMIFKNSGNVDIVEKNIT